MSFPNENGGGGFGFDFQGKEDENMDNSTVSDSGDGGREPDEVARTVIVLFFTLVGVIIGVVAIVYVLAIVFDRYMCCCPWFIPLPTDETALQLDNGPVAHKAGLWGLRIGERRMILDRLLVAKPYSKDMQFTKLANDVENPAVIDKNLVQDDNVEGDSNLKKAEEEAIGTGLEEQDDGSKKSDQDSNTSNTKEATISEGAAKMDDAEHLTTCAICLTDYAEGEMVLQSRSCEHMFHQTCAMEWLDKHDHCPFCRKEMVTPTEFRETAIEILGEERMKVIAAHRRVNETTGDNDEAEQANDDDDVPDEGENNANDEADQADDVPDEGENNTNDEADQANDEVPDESGSTTNDEADQTNDEVPEEGENANSTLSDLESQPVSQMAS